MTIEKRITVEMVAPREIRDYPWWYRTIFVIHPDGELELDLTYQIAIPYLAWAMYVMTKLASGDWKPNVIVAVAVLVTIAGGLGLIYLSSMPVDKQRIAAKSRIPGDMANAVARVMGDTPADNETLVDRSDD